MTIIFRKSGTFTGAFLRDSYRTEYTFSTLSELPFATLTYENFTATIRLNDTSFRIQPVVSNFTIKKYEIFEEDSVIGQITGHSIKLSTGNIFKCKRCYKSFWERLRSGPNYWIQLQSKDDLISYKFVTEARFDDSNNERYRELKGEIETRVDNLAFAIFGVFFIERLLQDEAGN